MDFGWSDEQLARRAAARDFAHRELADGALAARDHEGRFARELWERCARFGILGLSVPAEYVNAVPSLNVAGVVSSAYDAGDSTWPPCSACSHTSMSDAVEQTAPAANVAVWTIGGTFPAVPPRMPCPAARFSIVSASLQYIERFIPSGAKIFCST